MKLKKLIIIFATLLMVTMLFTSCDAADNGYVSGMDSMENVGSGSIDGIGSTNDFNSSTNKPSTSVQESTGKEYETKIIKTANLETQTKEFDSAIAEIEVFVKELGGYIESSKVTGNNIGSYRNGKTAQYSLRVPSIKFEEFLSYTESKLHVVSTTTTSQDVSLKYYDLKSRLEVLESERQALNKMLENAKTTNEILSIRNQLTDVIADIESIETQLRVYDSKVNYSTVTLRVEEVVEYTEIAEPDPTWWSRIKEAFVESWSDFAEWWQDFTVWLVRVFPTLIIIGFFGGIVAVIIFFVNKRDKKLRQAKNKNLKQ